MFAGSGGGDTWECPACTFDNTWDNTSSCQLCGEPIPSHFQNKIRHNGKKKTGMATATATTPRATTTTATATAVGASTALQASLSDGSNNSSSALLCALPAPPTTHTNRIPPPAPLVTQVGNRVVVFTVVFTFIFANRMEPLSFSWSLSLLVSLSLCVHLYTCWHMCAARSLAMHAHRRNWELIPCSTPSLGAHLFSPACSPCRTRYCCGTCCLPMPPH